MAQADPRAEIALDAHLAYVETLTDAGGGTVAHDNGIVLYASPHPLPFLVNGVARTDPSVAAKSVVDAALVFFSGRDRGFEVLILEDRDEDLAEAAGNAGLTIGSPDPIQVLAGAPRSGPFDGSGVDVLVVTDEPGVRAVAEVNGDASQVYGLSDAFFPTIFARPDTVLAANIHAIVVYEAERPVATAQIVMRNEVAYVAWVAVVQTAMRHGLGWFVTEKAIEAGIDRGARTTVLLASPMGAPLYRKMGFGDVGFLHNAYYRLD